MGAEGPPASRAAEAACPPRSTAGLTLVQATAISARAPPGRRALPGRLAAHPGAAPPGFAPGHGAARMCAPFAPAAGSGEARARRDRPVGGGELPGAATGARLAAPAPAPPADGTLPPRLALRGTVGLPAAAANPAEGLLVPK